MPRQYQTEVFGGLEAHATHARAMHLATRPGDGSGVNQAELRNALEPHLELHSEFESGQV